MGELRPSQVYISALTIFSLNNASGGLLWVSHKTPKGELDFILR